MRYLIFIIFLTFTAPLVSQEFNGGLMAGLAGSQIAGDNDSGYNKAGIMAGGWANFQLNRKMFFQMELSFFQKGSRHNPNYEEEDFRSFKINLNYFEMPFLFQYIINERWKAELGPSIALTYSHYEELLESELPTENFRLINLNINAGVYYELTDRLQLNFRTNNALVNLRNVVINGSVKRFFWFGQYNDVLVISLFYQL